MFGVGCFELLVIAAVAVVLFLVLTQSRRR
jgi:Sec-independent protein translocase protein TatA